MKDSQYIPGPPKNNNNGDIMSGGGGGGGGGRREEGGGGRAASGSTSYPHWPPHPLSSHHQFRSHHSQLPRMMGTYYGGRGMPPAAAHFVNSGGWSRATASQGGGGLKPPERWAPVVGSSTAATGGQQAEGGMDLSQTRSNGSQPNGVAKEAVSVIATNPLRTSDKPLEPSDRSEDEDEDCMVIEESEETLRTNEPIPVPLRQSSDDVTRQSRLQRDSALGQEAALEAPPAAHHNPLRHPSLPSPGTGSTGRPESSHHLPPSVTQPLRSDSSSPLQKSSPLAAVLGAGVNQQSLRADSSSPHQALPKAPPLQALVKSAQSESSHHLPVSVQGLQKPSSPLTQKPGSPSLQAQHALQFAKQILAQKQMQDSQMLAQQKLTESGYQQLRGQKLLASTPAEAAHQLLIHQKLQASASLAQQVVFQQRPDLTSVSQAQIPLHKTAGDQSASPVQLHKPSSPGIHASPLPQSHSKVSVSRALEGISVTSQFREAVSQCGQPPQSESPLSLAQDVRMHQSRHESPTLPPNLPINIPSSLQVIPHPVGSSVTSNIVKENTKQSALDQRQDVASLPLQAATRTTLTDSSVSPSSTAMPLPEAVAKVPARDSPTLPPTSDDPLSPQVATISAVTVASTTPAANLCMLPQVVVTRLPLTELSSTTAGSVGVLPQAAGRLPTVESLPPAGDTKQPSPPVAATVHLSPQVGVVKEEETLSAVQHSSDTSLTSQHQPDQPKDKPATEAFADPLPGDNTLTGFGRPDTVDHVESMLENMFQQDDSPTRVSQQPCTAITSGRSSPALTEDKVVQILQDKDDEQLPPIKQEIKTEILDDGNTGQVAASGSAFMQVESELEKMFAGIVETPGDSDKPETPESSKSSKKSASVKRNKGRPRPKKELESGGKKRRNKSPHGIDPLKLKKKLGARTEKIKEGSNDSSSISTAGQMYKWRGPYIRVSRGLDGRPSSVTLVNSSSASIEEDKDRSLDKSIKRKAPRIVEGRTKGPGLYSSTLSSKYNSTIIDVTWTCVFCNRRSHCENGLGGEPAGDLFGPYLVHIKLEPLVGGPSDADIVSEQRKRGGGKQLSLRAGGKANHSFSPPQKKSRKSSVSEKEAYDPNSGVVSRDVWVHEACAIWAPGVILVGPHLIGLDDAVSISLHSRCAVCGESGACISCLQHGCHKVCHYGCARATQWSLDEETFHARCLNHKKITISLALQQSSV